MRKESDLSSGKIPVGRVESGKGWLWGGCPELLGGAKHWEWTGRGSGDEKLDQSPALAETRGRWWNYEETHRPGMGQLWSMPGLGEAHQTEGHEPRNRVLRAEIRWPMQLGLCHREQEDFSSFDVCDNYRGLHLQKSRKCGHLVTRKLIVFSVLLVQSW